MAINDEPWLTVAASDIAADEKGYYHIYRDGRYAYPNLPDDGELSSWHIRNGHFYFLHPGMHAFEVEHTESSAKLADIIQTEINLEKVLAESDPDTNNSSNGGNQ